MMQLNLRMLYATDNVTAFSIDDDIYYLIMVVGIPVVFDSNLNRMTIPNFDSWLQANTGQRIGRQTFFDMVTIFRQGMLCGYPPEHVNRLIREVAIETKNAIFHTRLVTEYSAKYSIEIQDTHRLLTSFAEYISSHFDSLLQKMGLIRFHNYLCRCAQVCEYNDVDPVVFRKLIIRLGRDPIPPRYPNTVDLDNSLADLVVRSVLEKKGHMPYNVGHEVVENVIKLERQ